MSFFKRLFRRGNDEADKKKEEEKKALEQKLAAEKAAAEKAAADAAVLAHKAATEAEAAAKIAAQKAAELEQKVEITATPIVDNGADATAEAAALAKAEQEAAAAKIAAEETARLAAAKAKADLAAAEKAAMEADAKAAAVRREERLKEAAKEKEALNKSLEKTRTGLFGKLSRAVAGKSKVDDEVLDELENILITSDVGLDTTVKIINRIEARVARDKYLNTSELNEILRDEIVQLLSENNTVDVQDFNIDKPSKPYVLMVVGVNGVGKTTTIGKLAYQLKAEGKKVVLGAGDTFRAAAVDQLKIWSERVGCDFYAKGMHTDPAAVAYETVEYAIENDCDVAIIDTAGRLHTKINLMHELTKIKRSMGKKMDGAPHDVLLVLDATTGQNAIEQAKKFTEATEVTCLALTKLDGTAKGGVAIGISDQFKIPIKYIGVGESIYQLQVFNKRTFVDTLFSDK